MTDVILIQPPYEDFYATPLRTYPLGLLYIAGALEKAGTSVSVLNTAEGAAVQKPYPKELSYLKKIYRPDRSPFSLFHGYYRYGMSVEDIIAGIEGKNPKAIGVSVLTSAYSPYAFELADALKNRFPGIPLFCGGHHPTRFPENCLEHFDYVIRGEGEEPAVSLLKNLLKGKARDAVTEPSFPEPELIPLREAVPVPGSRHGKFTQILTSRGCPYRCSYCCTGSGNTGKFRLRNVGDIVDEFRICIEEFGIGHFDIEDENFTFSRERTIELLEKLILLFEGKDIRLSAMNGLLPETLDPELIRCMYKAGFRDLDLSLGSFNKDILKLYQRPSQVVERFMDIVPAAVELGMNITVYIINGGPYTSVESSAEDLFRASQIPVKLGLSNYYPAPGSPDYENSMFDIPGSFAMYRSSVYPVEAGLDRLEMSTASRLARLLNFTKGFDSLGDAEPFAEHETYSSRDGTRLVKTFFNEGRICGIEPGSKKVYFHSVSQELIQLFLDKLSKTGTIQTRTGELLL